MVRTGCVVTKFDRPGSHWLRRIDKAFRWQEVVNMSDDKLITECYEQLIKTVFSQFYQATILAKSSEEKSRAEQIFQTGVVFARQVRDRALAILPPV
jgi:hypothetical protein